MAATPKWAREKLCDLKVRKHEVTYKSLKNEIQKTKTNKELQVIFITNNKEIVCNYETYWAHVVLDLEEAYCRIVESDAPGTLKPDGEITIYVTDNERREQQLEGIKKRIKEYAEKNKIAGEINVQKEIDLISSGKVQIPVLVHHK